MATPMVSFTGMFPFLFNFWIISLILFYPVAMMWRMPWEIFLGRVAEFLGSSHWDFSPPGEEKGETGRKKKR